MLALEGIVAAIAEEANLLVPKLPDALDSWIEDRKQEYSNI